MIILENVSKSYQVGDQTSTVLSNINLEIKEKEFIGIIGPSGSGKSTLMHIIGLLDQPSRGKVLIDNKDTSTLSDDQISKLRNEYIGFVFQQFNLIEKLTVLENVLLPTKYAKKNFNGEVEKRALELLAKFGIEKRKDYYPNRISGGEQQRTAIARALIMNPKLVLADEPTGNLDSKTGSEILKLIANLNEEFGVTVVIVTHEMEVARKTKRKIYLRDGKIVKEKNE